MLKKFILTLLAASAVLLVNGCRSADWNRNRAVERARTYLLEHSRNLNQAQIDFIRFNDPILLKSPIYSGAEEGGMTVGLGSELNQICVTWQVPDIPELLMVYGVSAEDMEYWYPERIIRKNFITHKQEFAAAVNTARNYAVSNLLKELTPVQMNHIRFTPPTVCLTDFATTSDPAANLTKEEAAAAQAALKNALQVSLIWQKDAASSVVFCGYFKPGFSGWDVNFAGTIPQTELAKHTVKKLRDPADIQKPATPQEKELFSAGKSVKENK